VARLLEQHTKALLAERGLAVPAGGEARTPSQAEETADRLGGRVVVKALVPANRRGKAGGIRFASDPATAAREAEALLGTTVCGWLVDSVLVEQELVLEQELFFSVLFDQDRQVPLAFASASGGLDIEEVWTDRPEATRVLWLDPLARPLPHRLRELWTSAGLSGPELLAATALAHAAVAVFYDTDARLLELNPVGLVRSDGVLGAVAVGALLDVDENAFARQPALGGLARVGAERGRPLTLLEEQARDVAAFEPYRGTARFVELDGDVGLLCGGGGGSLVFFDAVQRAGGRPACLTELGGNPSDEKVRRLARVVLSCPGVKGLLVGHNITNNTQVDLVARGVLAALEEFGLDPREFPVVAREVGTNDGDGRELLERAGVEYLGEDATMEEAAGRIVERIRDMAGSA
jgi:succinyl-CoA synthetase beta subunit